MLLAEGTICCTHSSTQGAAVSVRAAVSRGRHTNLLSCTHWLPAAGGSWKYFNEMHLSQRHHLAALYGNKKRLYGNQELVKTFLRHAVLPIFLIQARSHIKLISVNSTGIMR